jgi:hypothetical protein
MSNKSEKKIWKEQSRLNLMYYPGISLEKLGKTRKTVRIAGVSAEIRSRQFPK